MRFEHDGEFSFRGQNLSLWCWNGEHRLQSDLNHNTGSSQGLGQVDVHDKVLECAGDGLLQPFAYYHRIGFGEVDGVWGEEIWSNG